MVPTNNATYTGTGQIEQQFAMSRLRAIETGRYVVVASTNGISGIVAPDGSVVERAPQRRQVVLERSVRLLDGSTPAVVAGRVAGAAARRRSGRRWPWWPGRPGGAVGATPAPVPGGAPARGRAVESRR